MIKEYLLIGDQKIILLEIIFKNIKAVVLRCDEAQFCEISPQKNWEIIIQTLENKKFSVQIIWSNISENSIEDVVMELNKKGFIEHDSMSPNDFISLLRQKKINFGFKLSRPTFDEFMQDIK